MWKLSVMTRNTALALLLVALASCSVMASEDVSQPKPPKVIDATWVNNSVGLEEIALPGFKPVEVDPPYLRLSAQRSYKWNRGVLPAELLHNSDLVVSEMTVVAAVDGEEVELVVDEAVDIRQSQTSAVVEAIAQVPDVFSSLVTTTVELDGLARSSLTLTPEDNFTIDGLYVKVRVKAKYRPTVLGFKADTVRNRVKPLRLELPYRGEFLNAIGIPNGENSFWRFADNAKGWIWNGDQVTEVVETADGYEIKLHLIGAPHQVTEEMTFDFNFMLTPVKELGSEWRRKRIARGVNKSEAQYSKVQLWWTTAFAHQSLPYFDYPASIEDEISEHDKEAYPGLRENQSLLLENDRIGIDRLPYFSGHTLSGYDPVFREFEREWAVSPPFVIPGGSDRPFTAALPKPWLSHRASGYNDYLIYRFNELAKDLDFQGLYFDQGGVIQTDNLASGGWIDSNGKLQASTDILAMRSFFKRLANVLHAHGREGYIYVHNSMSPIVPAYSFITGMVQGEEFVQYLEDYDYIESTDLELARAKFAPGQYGLISTWLSELWSYKVDGGKPRLTPLADWQETETYKKALRKFLALALLHDTQLMTLAPFEQRSTLYQRFDDFGVDQSDFFGYWLSNKANPAEGLYISYYKNEADYLVIVSNLNSQPQELGEEELEELLGHSISTADSTDATDLFAQTGRISLKSKDFLIINVR